MKFYVLTKIEENKKWSLNVSYRKTKYTMNDPDKLCGRLSLYRAINKPG